MSIINSVDQYLQKPNDKRSHEFIPILQMRTMREKEIKEPELGCRTVIYNRAFILGDNDSIGFDAIRRVEGGIMASWELKFPARKRRKAILSTGW